MKTSFVRLALMVCGIGLVGNVSSAMGRKESASQETVEAVAEKVRPSLVRLHVVWVEYGSGREQKFEASGSGAIISSEGHIITNHHVAGKAKRVFCTLSNKEELEAVLVGTDAMSDIAVLKLVAESGRTFQPLAFGDSSAVKVGDPVLAMGSPLALSQSVTMGIVSNTDMIMPSMFRSFKFELEGEDVGSIVKWIGHDASIYGGNSGGPLTNMRGEMIGINEISFGLSGAIPGNLARSVSEALVQSGRVRRAWLGIEVQPRLENDAHGKGILVSGCLAGSPAAQAGFQPGDLLLSLAGQAVDVRFDEQVPLFNQMVCSLKIGEAIQATVLRQDKELALQVIPQEREPAEPQEEEIKEWGIAARNLSVLLARELKRDNTEGVLVTSVRPGGPAGQAKPGLNPRDVLLKMGDIPVKNLSDLKAATIQVTQGQEDPVPVVVSFDRAQEQLVTVLKVGIASLEDPGLEARKAWVGVGTQVLTREIRKEMGLDNKTGVRITQVYENTGAAGAGLKVGDILVALDGQRIQASDPQDVDVFSTMVRQYRIGAEVEFSLIRDGKEETLKVKCDQSPPLPREMKKYKDEMFEFEARDIAFIDRENERWTPDLVGALVSSVDDGGWAALGKLESGDLILEVDGQGVSGVEDLKKKMEAKAQEKSKMVVFRVLRGIHALYLEFKPSW